MRPRNMRSSSTSLAPLVPDFPPKLDPGERVYPIRFSIGTPYQIESSGEAPIVTPSQINLGTSPATSTPSSAESESESSTDDGAGPSDDDGTVVDVHHSESPLITEKHEYAVVGEGDHGVDHRVLFGSRGRREFQRCEDEPIHIPGAIQSFGVLIAIRLVERGKLQVRIASENCESFCQYSPTDLFALENFSDIFPDHYRNSFDAKAWYIQEQYMRAHVEVEPIVFSTVIRTPRGDSLPVSCAVHFVGQGRDLLVCEFESQNSLEPSASTIDPDMPSKPVVTLDVDPIIVSLAAQPTKARPLHLNRLVHSLHPDERSTTETVSIMAQIQQELTACRDFEELLDTVVSVVQQLTRFHRVMVYRFDKVYNGQVVAEAIIPEATGDLYKGLHFPASDIPPQARRLYQINKVRLLFDREMPTARLVCQAVEDMEKPLDLTHSYLRAMSPIHIKYLGNMGVRSTASISLQFNDKLWGLICCHSYGPTATHVSFSVREVCYWIGLCVSNCIAKLSYSSRLGARKLLETIQVDKDPQSCITASSSDILRLFGSNSGFMVIQGEARTVGKHESYLEAILVLRYVHLRAYTTVVSTHNITEDHPNFPRSTALDTIAGFLFIPLSNESDYMLFFRTHQMKEVHWAGNPHAKEMTSLNNTLLEPRASFKRWTEIVTGASKEWTQEEYQEYATTVRLVYGKFIEVWRANERSLFNTKTKRILLLNASHEARTPLNAIINYLEVAMENRLDNDTRELLRKSHSASQSLVYIIDDLLNLTRSQDGSFPLLELGFDIRSALAEALKPLEDLASGKGLQLLVFVDPNFPQFVRGDFQRFQQAIVHVVSNAIRCTANGCVQLEANLVDRNDAHCLVEIKVSDTGIGIAEDHLDELFQELEQIPSEDSEMAKPTVIGKLSRDPTPIGKPVLGLGLATVARFTRLRSGLLKVRSTRGVGTIVSLLLPFPRSSEAFHPFQLPTPPVEDHSTSISTTSGAADPPGSSGEVSGSDYAHGFFDLPVPTNQAQSPPMTPHPLLTTKTMVDMSQQPMMVMVADDNKINRQILKRRLERMDHQVETASDGQQCYGMFKEYSAGTHFILMDLDASSTHSYWPTRTDL
ncbi:phytochrome-like protein [Venturia nashicola]|uniref:Phytochrome-like protein n=1 Tax=Venturia nashicola TaxID=86259 RepID=A0A4Z1NHX7_9PEZI|nr:phytochrome-like protein [Venturia nashicola]TLD21668.1 phytochrome-like protein [Venturia nashicola]